MSNENTDDSQMALLRNDMNHMAGDVAEIKGDFKEFRKFYVTKSEIVELDTSMRRELALQQKDLEIVQKDVQLGNEFRSNTKFGLRMVWSAIGLLVTIFGIVWGSGHFK